MGRRRGCDRGGAHGRRNRRAGALGDLDPAYGTGGKTTVDFGGDDLVGASVLQSDGSLVTVGNTAPGTGGDDMAVSRLALSGAPDPAFGSGGKATIDFTGGDDKAFAVALQPDGKIVVAGQTTGGLGGEPFAVARLTSAGVLDPTFGGGGETTVDFGGSQEGVTAALVTSGGQIILTGFANPATTGLDFAAARLNANGNLDTTSGSAGKATVDFGGDDDGEAATLTPDGHIIIGGSTTASGGGDVAVTQLNPDGSLDTTFGTSGKATVDFGGSDLASSILRDSAGRIVVAGQTSAGTGGGDVAVARLTSAGALDPSFGTAGKTLVDFSSVDRAFAAAFAPDGGIFVTGGSNITAAGDYAIRRLTAAGALDSAFASGGKATVDFGDGQGDVARAVVLQPDGKILVSGTEGNFHFGVARLLGEVAGTGTGTGIGTVSGGAFEATASGGGYTMHVHVSGATKPNVLYTIPSGSSSSYVTVNGYSSTAALKTGVGGVKFINVTVGRKRRLRVSLGYDALFRGTGELVLVPEKGGRVC